MTNINFDANFWNSVSGDTYTLTGDVYATGGEVPSGKTLEIPSNYTLHINSGVTFVNNGNIDNNYILYNISQGTFINNGTITNNSTFFNDGTFTNNYNIYNNEGSKVYNAGTFTNNYNINNNETARINNSITHTIINNHTITNNGTITNSGSILSNSVINNSSGTAAPPTGTGTYYYPNNGGTPNQIDITADFTLPVGSSLTIKSGTTLQINASKTFTNESVLNNKDGAITIQTSGSLVNGTSSNAGFIGNSGTITNNGTLNNTNGTILSNDPVSGTAPSGGTYYYAGNYSGANEIIPLNDITIPTNGYFTINNGNKMRFNSGSTTFTNNGTFHIQPNAMLQPETLNNNHRIINEGVILSYTGQLVSSTSSTFQNNGYIMINLVGSSFTFHDLENNGTILSNNVTTKNGTTTDNGNIFEPNGTGVIEIDSDFTMPKLNTTNNNMTVFFIIEGGKKLQINSNKTLTNNGTIYNNRVGSQIINNGTIINNSTLSNGAYTSNTIVNTNGTILSNQSYDSKISGGTYYYPGNNGTTNQIDITSNFTLPDSSTFNVPDGKTLQIHGGVTFTV